MHKRARNHHNLVYCQMADKFYFRHCGEVEDLNWKVCAKEMYYVYDDVTFKYEPQGKRLN